MSLKNYISAGYGTSIYKDTKKLKNLILQQTKLKKQQIFLQRCISNRIIPKSYRIHSPLTSDRAKQLRTKYSFDLITCAKNEVKKSTFTQGTKYMRSETN